MIVKGMSYEQIYKECISDVEEIYPRAFQIVKNNKAIKKYIKEKNKCFKKSRYYNFKYFTLTSSRNNTVFVYPSYDTLYKYFCFSSCVLYNFGSGYHAVHVSYSNSLAYGKWKVIFIFTPHFLDRFRERFMKDNTITKFEVIKTLLDESNREIGIRYTDVLSFEDSEVSSDLLERMKQRYPGRHVMFPITDKGIAICEELEDIGLVFKTYLSLDILKESQKNDLNVMIENSIRKTEELLKYDNENTIM